MRRLVPKHFYITFEQDKLLRRHSRELGVSQSAIPVAPSTASSALLSTYRSTTQPGKKHFASSRDGWP
jgi:hypothetical protein